jgi:hypothetical protein
MTAEGLLVIYDPARQSGVKAGGMGYALKRAGFRKVYGTQVVHTRTGGYLNLWAVRNQARLLAIRDHDRLVNIYEDERGIEQMKKILEKQNVKLDGASRSRNHGCP